MSPSSPASALQHSDGDAVSPTASSNEQHPTLSSTIDSENSNTVSEAEHIERRQSPSLEASPHEKAAHHYQHPRGEAGQEIKAEHGTDGKPIPAKLDTTAATLAQRQESPATDAIQRAGRGSGPARYGGMGEFGVRDSEFAAREAEDEEENDRRLQSGSKQFVGGPNQTFMHMIHALAKDESSAGTADDDTSSPGADHDQPRSPAVSRPQRVWSDAAAGEENETTSESEESDAEGNQHRASGSAHMRESRRIQSAQPPALSRSSTARGGTGQPSHLSAPITADDAAQDEDNMASSSIHAIHRPIAARKRTLTGEPGEAVGRGGVYVQQRGGSRSRAGSLAMSPTDAGSLTVSKEERDRLHDSGQAWSGEKNDGDEDGQAEADDDGVDADTRSRSGSMKSVVRREKLAEKLGDIFGLDGTEEVVAEFPCWLFRSVLLQGFAFLTTGHICFYAYLQKKEGSVVRSGALSARGSKTRRYYKHWFVLKDDVLSWYPSSTDPYFPDGHIDLHYCTSIESSSFHKHHFKIATAEKKWHFSAESEQSRDEWVKTLKKAVFRCQNEGESVRIAIPLETVIDIEKSTHLEFAETIRVRVYDADEGYSIDEYWFSYMNDMDLALEKMAGVLEAYQRRHENESVHTLEHVQDTTHPADHTLSPPGSPETKAQDGGEADSSEKTNRSLAQRLTSLSSSTSTAGGSTSAPTRHKTTLSRILHPGGNSSPSSSTTTLTTPVASEGETTLEGSTATLPDHEHRYPPAPSTSGESHSATGSGSSSTWNPLPHMPTWLKNPPMKLINATPGLPNFSSASRQQQQQPLQQQGGRSSTAPALLGGPKGSAVRPRAPRRITEVVSSGPSGARPVKETAVPARMSGESAREHETEDDLDEDDDALVAAAGDGADDGEHHHKRKERRMNEKFRKTFGLADKEVVVAHWPAYLFRGLPISGKLYMSTSYVCFKSSGLLAAAKTRMIVPISDIIGVEKHRSYRIGYSGLILTIKGHEELFLELANTERRDAVLTAIEQRIEVIVRQAAANLEHHEKEAADSLEAHDFERQQHLDLLDLALPKASEAEIERLGEGKANLGADVTGPNAHPPPETTPGQPPVMFCSTSSDFVTFRPEKSLRFTCLTIGSRGDVQPYIALCKGLMAEGHTCKITSHGEYREWVEGHGIEFESVGGDPGDLMQLMIAHDFFTISFMKEAVGKFRSWLDDLLATAWKACQNTDVLIESPSAMAGYHIAEALQIPYYRAFTMPWTRTRAYPHAFAVPDVKMGGAYNYMTYTMFDQVFWRATSGQINRWRKKHLGIAPTNFEAMQQHKIPFLYNFSPVVIPPPLDWRENIHVTGYWWLDNPDNSKSSKWEPPQELLDFLDEARDKGKKVVFIGFGSIIIPDPVQMTSVVSEAVEKADVYAIIAKGWSDRSSKSKDDSEEVKEEAEQQEKKEAQILRKPFIHNVKTVPHDWLFPRIDAAVHHGGAGTTGASLRAGLPTIIKPFFGDQHFYADRVATLGIGSAVKNMTVENLSEALIKAVSDEKQIAKAKLAGEQIRKEDGVGNAIECIYRDLEYARSLIPAPSVAPPSATRTTTSASIDTQQTVTSQLERELFGGDVASSKVSGGEDDVPRAQHQRTESAQTGTGPSSSASDEGSWAVVSSQEGTGESTRWENDSSLSSSAGGRSRSRGRADAAALATDDEEDGSEDLSSTHKHGRRFKRQSKKEKDSQQKEAGLASAVLEAFGRSAGKTAASS